MAPRTVYKDAPPIQKTRVKRTTENARVTKGGPDPADQKGWKQRYREILTSGASKFLTGKPIKNDTLPGEHHGILKMPNGSLERAAYMGPGTQVIRRLQRGDKGKTPVDKIAKQHDIDYELATTPKDITIADKKMIQRVKNLMKIEGDSALNVAQANLIKLKRGAEAVLGHNKLKFGSLDGKPSAERAILLRNRQKLYGV